MGLSRRRWRPVRARRRRPDLLRPSSSAVAATGSGIPAATSLSSEPSLPSSWPPLRPAIRSTHGLLRRLAIRARRRPATTRPPAPPGKEASTSASPAALRLHAQIPGPRLHLSHTARPGDLQPASTVADRSPGPLPAQGGAHTGRRRHAREALGLPAAVAQRKDKATRPGVVEGRPGLPREGAPPSLSSLTAAGQALRLSPRAPLGTLAALHLEEEGEQQQLHVPQRLMQEGQGVWRRSRQRRLLQRSSLLFFLFFSGVMLLRLLLDKKALSWRCQIVPRPSWDPSFGDVSRP